MKSFIVFALVVAVAVAAPQQHPYDESKAEVISFESNNIGVEGYDFGYKTSNGITAVERGELKNTGTENESIGVSGQYSYTGPDGVIYTVEYIANENGFQPRGAHIPQAA